MKYSIEIGKIVEGALKHDYTKIRNYTEQLINKLQLDGEERAANKFIKILNSQNNSMLNPMGSENKVPVDIESRISMADIIEVDDNNCNVILSENNNFKLKSFILSYKNADKLNSAGIGLSNTLLLYGPPGCGKTQCAYLIAKELKLPLVIARLDSIISSYLGTTAKNIRTLFEYAQKMPCVLFLDEFDAIAKARDDGNELGELKRVVNSLLQNIDSMSKDTLLIAATNHDKLLDSAIWRRFDYKLEIEIPDMKACEQLVDLFLGNNLEITEKEKKIMSYAFAGLSGANIENIIKKSIRNSIIFEHDLKKQDIYEEIFSFNGIYANNGIDERQILQKKARFLRKCNEKIFSYSVIADILNVSKTKVSTLLSEEGK